MAGRPQILANRRDARKSTGSRTGDHAKQRRFSGTRLLRRFAPRKDRNRYVRSSGESHPYASVSMAPGPPHGRERVRDQRHCLSKQSQFPGGRMNTNCRSGKGSGRLCPTSGSCKTNPNKANSRGRDCFVGLWPPRKDRHGGVSLPPWSGGTIAQNKANLQAWFNIVHPVVTLLGHRVGGTGKLVLPVGLG
jgi:hypothetical protein